MIGVNSLLAENNSVYVLCGEFCQSDNIYFKTRGGRSHMGVHMSALLWRSFPERSGNRICDQEVNPGE